MHKLWGCSNEVKIIFAWPSSTYGSAPKPLLSPPNPALPRLCPLLPHVPYSAFLLPHSRVLIGHVYYLVLV